MPVCSRSASNLTAHCMILILQTAFSDLTACQQGRNQHSLPSRHRLHLPPSPPGASIISNSNSSSKPRLHTLQPGQLLGVTPRPLSHSLHTKARDQMIMNGRHCRQRHSCHRHHLQTPNRSRSRSRYQQHHQQQLPRSNRLQCSVGHHHHLNTHHLLLCQHPPPPPVTPQAACCQCLAALRRRHQSWLPMQTLAPLPSHRL